MPAKEAPPPRPTVLVVEDDDAMRRALGRVLASHGFDVVTAASAAEALKAGSADVGIVDVDLPDLDGPELARQLLLTARVGLVLFFTAAARGERRAEAAGIGAVIDKGEGIEALLAALRRVGG